jgi:hypothetical protein
VKKPIKGHSLSHWYSTSKFQKSTFNFPNKEHIQFTYKMAASVSTQFGLVLLISIGTLLLLLTMAPQFGAGNCFSPNINLAISICPSQTALECHYVNVRGSSLGGRPAAAAWQLNKLMNVATINGTFGVAADGGKQGMQCPVDYNHCLTLHCPKFFGKFNVTAVHFQLKTMPLFAQVTKQ